MTNWKRWGILLSVGLCTAAHAQMANGTYVGDGLAAHAITTGFRPLFVLVRGTGSLASVVRLANMPAGMSKTATTAATLALGIVSFEDDGFTVGSAAEVNAVGQTFHWAAIAPSSSFTLGTYVGDAVNGRAVSTGYMPDFIFTFPDAANIPVFASSAMPAGASFGTGGASTLTDGITAMTTTGFTVGTGAANTSGVTFYFLAGTATATGLSMGTYVGDNLDGRVINTSLPPLLALVRANGQSTVERFASMAPTDDSLNMAGGTTCPSCIRSITANSFTIGTDNRVNDPGRPYYWLAFGVGIQTTLTQGPGAFSNTQSPTFEFGSNSSGATFECKLDGAATFTACATPLMLSGLSVSSHVIEVRARNGAELDLTPLVHSWVIDLTVPDTSFTATPNAASNDASPTFDFACTEANCTYECQLDGAPSFTACADPLALSGLSDSAHVLRVRAVDPALNVDPTPLVFNWTIDTSSPDTTLDQLPSTASTRPIVTFSSNEPASFQCSVDSAAFATCTSPLQLGPLTNNASHTFAVRAIDAAGNVDSSPSSHNWSIAATLPDTSISVAPPSVTADATAVFEFTSTSAGTFECSFDGAPFATCPSPTTLVNVPIGVHVFAVSAIDTENNIDPTPATHTWTVDPGAGCGCASAAPNSLWLFALALLAARPRTRRLASRA